MFTVCKHYYLASRLLTLSSLKRSFLSIVKTNAAWSESVSCIIYGSSSREQYFTACDRMDGIVCTRSDRMSRFTTVTPSASTTDQLVLSVSRPCRQYRWSESARFYTATRTSEFVARAAKTCARNLSLRRTSHDPESTHESHTIRCHVSAQSRGRLVHAMDRGSAIDPTEFNRLHSEAGVSQFQSDDIDGAITAAVDTIVGSPQGAGYHTRG
jgi:hypothetical protein